jgi:hypothetical protein
MIVLCEGSDNIVYFRATGTLDEASLGVNFNPPGLPLDGQQDNDQVDSHPASLRGLFHVIRSSASSDMTTIDSDLPQLGCWLISGSAEVQAGSYAADVNMLAQASATRNHSLVAN